MVKQNRREFIKSAATGTAALGLLPLANSLNCVSKKPLNVIFIMSDQHRATSMGVYGSTEVLTPHLDQLAKQSVLFENTYCQYPQCVASRQTIITGQYCNSHGCYGNINASIDENQWTVASAFSDAGYDTALIGKDHCNKKGFAQDRSSNKHYNSWPQELKDRIQHPKYGFNYRENARTAGPVAFEEKYLIETYVREESIRFLKEKHNDPFFAQFSFTKPHPPFNPPKRFWDMYEHDKIKLPKLDPQEPRENFWPEDILTPDMMRNYLHGYYASISYMDWCVGELLNIIKDEGYWDNSIIVYTSDHGDNAGSHWRYEKHCVFDEAIKVPLLIRTPDTKPHRVKEYVELADLAPTFTDLCNIPVKNHQFDGGSLDGLLSGNPEGWKNYATCEYYNKYKKIFGRMLVENNFKCSIDANLPYPKALFNLENDPDEFINLWDDPKYEDIRNAMVAKINMGWKKKIYPCS